MPTTGATLASPPAAFCFFACLPRCMTSSLGVGAARLKNESTDASMSAPREPRLMPCDANAAFTRSTMRSPSEAWPMPARFAASRNAGRLIAAVSTAAC